METFQLLTPRASNGAPQGGNFNRSASTPSYDNNMSYAPSAGDSSEMDDDLPF